MPLILPITFARIYRSGAGYVFQGCVGGKAIQYEIGVEDIDGLDRSISVAREQVRREQVAA